MNIMDLIIDCQDTLGLGLCLAVATGYLHGLSHIDVPAKHTNTKVTLCFKN